MKKYLMLCLGVFGLVLSYGILAMAQAASPAMPVPSPGQVVPVVASGVAGIIASKGGLLMFGLLLLTSFNMAMSALRQILYAWDGIKQGDPIPANYAGLTKVNMICLWLGKVVDWATANLAH